MGSYWYSVPLLVALVFSSHAFAIQLVRQKDGKSFDVTAVPQEAIQSVQDPPNSSSKALLPRDGFEALGILGLAKRQDYYTCADTGVYVDPSTHKCCIGYQCYITSNCCGTGCCDANHECCQDLGCCDVDESCYRYRYEQYQDFSYTCLTPAEAEEYFDVQGTYHTTYSVSATYGSNAGVSATSDRTWTSRYISSASIPGAIYTSSSYDGYYSTPGPITSSVFSRPEMSYSSKPRAGYTGCAGDLSLLSGGGITCIDGAGTSGFGPTASTTGFGDQGGSFGGENGGSVGNTGERLEYSFPEMVLLGMSVVVGALLVVL